MDLSDALNYMFWSSPLPDGSPGYAAWDIFRAEDSVEVSWREGDSDCALDADCRVLHQIRDFLYGIKAKQLGLPIEEVRAGQDELVVVARLVSVAAR